VGGYPTWGEVFRYSNKEIGEPKPALYKCHDYDYPYTAYCEKIWSIIGKIMLDDCRVPNIDIVGNEGKGREGLLSYRLLRKQTEDLIDMHTLTYHKYSREQLKAMQSHLYIEDLIECVRLEVGDNDNFERLKRDIIETIILDSITNLADRHDENWGLIKSKEDKAYDIALYDHAISFVDMFTTDLGRSSEGWAQSYLKTVPQEKWTRQYLMGDMGNKLVGYISERYPNEFNEFMRKFNDRIGLFYQFIDTPGCPADLKRIRSNIREKRRLIEDKYIKGEER